MRKLLNFVFLLALTINSASAQEPGAQSMSVLEFSRAAIDALGGMDVQGIEFSGEGWDACLGQAWFVDEGWARWELKDYHRAIDYDQGMSSQFAMRRSGMDPGRIGGCGAQPEARPREQQTFIDATASWPDQLPIWLTPHGVLHLLKSGEPVIERQTMGWKVTLPLEHDGIFYTVVGYYNTEFELENLQTKVDNSIYGDMPVRVDFGEYQAFGDLRFPRSIDIQQGGHTTFFLTINAGSPLEEPLLAPLQSSGSSPSSAQDVVPSYTQIGEGIFAVHGFYQSVVMEFADFSVVIDGLQSDARAQELIRLVKQVIPNKPIRYVVSTHSHFDHASGLRLFSEEGAIILTHAMNVDFFQEALSMPRTLRVEGTEPEEVNINILGIDGQFVLSDGEGQRMELYSLTPNAHAKDMLIAYLPTIEAVVEADILQPWINPRFSGEGEGPHPSLVHLDAELERIGINYQRFVPIHEPPTPPMMGRSALEDAVRD